MGGEREKKHYGCKPGREDRERAHDTRERAHDRSSFFFFKCFLVDARMKSVLVTYMREIYL